ncbi:MAG: triose-phosphate isomerase [Candidatus Taylorbacteria bacterium]
MQAKKQKIIIGNWKMNPLSIGEAKEIFLGVKKVATSLTNVKTVICPPFVYLSLLNKLYTDEVIAFGAQNVFWDTKGAFTGEISAPMIKSVGGSFVIVGHSERRNMGETDEVVQKKTALALRSGLTAVVCIGEKERDKDGNFFHFLKGQIRESLKGLHKKHLERIVIAYEPIWAINKSDKDAMSPGDLREMAIFIRKNLVDHFKTASAASISILYGGSASSSTAKELVGGGQVDGLLVGHQSLDVTNFSDILKTVNAL